MPGQRPRRQATPDIRIEARPARCPRSGVRPPLSALGNAVSADTLPRQRANTQTAWERALAAMAPVGTGLAISPVNFPPNLPGVRHEIRNPHVEQPVLRLPGDLHLRHRFDGPVSRQRTATPIPVDILPQGTPP